MTADDPVQTIVAALERDDFAAAEAGCQVLLSEGATGEAMYWQSMIRASRGEPRDKTGGLIDVNRLFLPWRCGHPGCRPGPAHIGGTGRRPAQKEGENEDIDVRNPIFHETIIKIAVAFPPHW